MTYQQLIEALNTGIDEARQQIIDEMKASFAPTVWQPSLAPTNHLKAELARAERIKTHNTYNSLFRGTNHA